MQQVMFHLKMTRLSVDLIAKMPQNCNSFVSSRFWQIINCKTPNMDTYTIVKVQFTKLVRDLCSAGPSIQEALAPHLIGLLEFNH